jgi:nicotinamide-nucleotide amidase
MGLLGVDAGLLQKHGAVSAPVAEAMAVGVLDACGADVAVSTTGIAGPDGGSVQKPVGLVFIGLACRNRPTFSERFIFSGNRKDIRLAASQMALEMIQRVFDL